MDQALEMRKAFNSAYEGRRVLLTGHSGFKGSWLAFWLKRLGAELAGFSLPPPTKPSHFELLGLEMKSYVGDVRSSESLKAAFDQFAPEIVFHLAAQPLVRRSYREPEETFEVNVSGTLKVLEACRRAPSTKAIVVVTSDKCYENREWVWGYRENDPMGGYDPYSASKGCAELLVASYRNSFFNNASYGNGGRALLASCRAGNVIGGGDWAEDRLVPDIMKAASSGRRVELRNPSATRPWQHALEPLSGYLLVGERLLAGDLAAASAWNFGPDAEGELSVGELAERIAKSWPKAGFDLAKPKDAPHEAGLLKLDCSKARSLLKWSPVWSADAAIERSVRWYRDYYERGLVSTAADLETYCDDAKAKGLPWTK